MKFSILLPTRNRVDLLMYAIESVRRQDYDDWEVIVYDNDSTDDIQGRLTAIADERIRYHRTDGFVPVTDNWNNALRESRGDYVFMLGDDDCLVKGALTRTAQMIQNNPGLEFIYANTWMYAYPGVLKEHPNGYLQLNESATFLKGKDKPFWMSPSRAKELVRQAMRFEMAYTFNMQHSVISRELITRMKAYGEFFQSPYPDFYATNALMLKAEQILVSPEPLVIVGLSPKSFGYYYFNDQEEIGIDFLNNRPTEKDLGGLAGVILPGLEDKTSWLCAMQCLYDNFKNEHNIKVDYSRYRYLQIFYVCLKYFSERYGNVARRKYAPLFEALRERLSIFEKTAYILPLYFAYLIVSLIPTSLRNNLIVSYYKFINKTPSVVVREQTQSYANIIQVFESL